MFPDDGTELKFRQRNPKATSFHDKKHRRTLRILLLLYLGSLVLNLCAQDKESPFLVEAKLIDRKTGKPIKGAHVINLSKGYGAVSDTSGLFQVFALSEDTLMFSAIGYEKAKVSAIRFLGFLKKYIYELNPKVYMLDDVKVFAMTWKSFKDSVIATVIPEELWREQRWIERIFTGTQLEELKELANRGRAIPMNYKTKADVQREKVVEFEQKDREADIAEKRFNKDVVGQITGLKDKALDDFFASFSFSTEKIQKLSDYQLILEIQNIHKAYQQKLEKTDEP